MTKLKTVIENDQAVNSKSRSRAGVGNELGDEIFSPFSNEGLELFGWANPTANKGFGANDRLPTISGATRFEVPSTMSGG
ncbi:ferredoxin-dependent glutamate synthase, chloroplastic [Corchorus olitorius]|uniref:Ferredoxin-dependent glutamate synthase, chloroplastic n=1 Tax=Corchorus olitorius TaxID=93759 RepID=A0A1R3KCG7_9ROSI|nr:ferredoxin-dependent glutamate synthase, chloroplastic [Corchorus olitorius]